MKVTARVTAIGDMDEVNRSTFMDWVWKARDINCFDPDILAYPRTIMVSADDETGPVLHVPVQPVLMLESLAPKPGITPRKEALALARCTELLTTICKDTGFKEEYFLCKDDRVADIAARHGWEDMQGYRLLRRKVKES